MIENLPIILTGIGLIVSILYYSMNLRNANKTQQLQLETRQLDLFMKWQQPQTTPEWMKNYLYLLNMKWDDFEDFEKKYDHTIDVESSSIRVSQWRYWDGLGYILSQGVIDSATVFEMIGNSAILLWDRCMPIIMGYRERDKRPETWRWFEYLADEMKKERDRRGLGAYNPPIQVQPAQ